jgi:hypothetical protein
LTMTESQMAQTTQACHNSQQAGRGAAARRIAQAT